MLSQEGIITQEICIYLGSAWYILFCEKDLFTFPSTEFREKTGHFKIKTQTKACNERVYV